MRRWWIVLGAAGVIALLVALLTPRDDGLDWIRAYGGRERAYSIGVKFLDKYKVVREFIFDESRPLRLEAEILKRAEKTAEHSDGHGKVHQIGEWNVRLGWQDSVEAYKFIPASWLERQWRALRGLLRI